VEGALFSWFPTPKRIAFVSSEFDFFDYTVEGALFSWFPTPKTIAFVSSEFDFFDYTVEGALFSWFPTPKRIAYKDYCSISNVTCSVFLWGELMCKRLKQEK
jgi:hypothetical protein